MNRSEQLFLTLLALLSVALRTRGLSELPWDEREIAAAVTAGGGRIAPLGLRLLSATIGSATPLLLYAVLRLEMGIWPAFATGLLVALGPWHLHLSRMGAAAGIGGIAAIGESDALLFALAGIGAALAVIGGIAPRGRRSLLARLGALACLVVAALALVRNAEPAGSHRNVPEWLAADVGLGVPLLALVGVVGRATRGRACIALLAAGLLVATGTGRAGSDALLAVALAPCCVAAGIALGTWCELAWASSRSLRHPVALLLLGLVPALPSLASELIDGGRFDLAPLARELALRRHAGEPVFAMPRALAARELGLECRELPAATPDAPPLLPTDRDAWIVLLFDRGRPLADATVAQKVETSCELITHSGRKRLDLHRYEARLYRSPRSRPAR